MYDTQAMLPDWKAERKTLKLVHSQVLQHVQVRVDLAFKAFFRRVKAGEQDAGYPRFKGFGRYDSMTFPQYGNGARLEGNKLMLSKIGAVQESRKLVNRFGMIVFEDLSITRMLKNHCLAKSIADAAWNQLATYTRYKAEEAGRAYIEIDPRGTSQRCSRCGAVVKKSLSMRVHQCPHCGLEIDRDLNAAYNILRLGLQSQGLRPQEAPRLLPGE